MFDLLNFGPLGGFDREIVLWVFAVRVSHIDDVILIDDLHDGKEGGVFKDIILAQLLVIIELFVLQHKF